jgi:hypothetical protein
MVTENQRQRLLPSAYLPAISAAGLLALTGCFDWSSLKPTAGDKAAETETELAADDELEALAGPATPADAFALAEVEPRQQKYLDAARPFIEAIATRDYAAAFDKLGPQARQKLSRNQFAPVEDEQEFAKHEAAAIENPTAQQFVELIQIAEAQYGAPARMDPPSIETDPDVLSRKDLVGAAYELGNMPDTIPVAHRKAAVQAWVYCKLTDEQIKAAAQEEGIDEAEYRRMMEESLAGGEGPYFKLKTVVVDDGTGPVVGYFELAPRGLLD